MKNLRIALKLALLALLVTTLLILAKTDVDFVYTGF
jgi:hypothetical protein